MSSARLAGDPESGDLPVTCVVYVRTTNLDAFRAGYAKKSPLTTPAPKLRFSVMSPFHADLKRRVDAHFASTGRSPQGGFAMWLKTATLFAWLAGSYAVLLFCAVSPWQAVLL